MSKFDNTTRKILTENLVIRNNSSPSIGVLQKKTTLYINLNVL